MKFRIVQPTGFLKNYIRHYCFMESGTDDGNVVERVVPTENIQLMFHYRNPFVEVRPDDVTVKQPRSVLCGLSNFSVDVSTNGEAGVIFIKFYPLGACRFFNFPLSEIENQSIDFSDVFHAEVRQIEEQLYLSKSLNERIAIIEAFLLKRFSAIPAYDSILLQKGIDIIKSRKGQINAASLSEILCVTPKTLERKFSQYLGKTTKQFVKLIHFQEVLLDFSTRKNISLTERAYNNGYFDQAHFIRDFKAFSGFTPKKFTARYPDFDYSSEYC